MKIYTRTGDKGDTSLIGGRVPKDDLQVEAYGTVDEANSCLGMAISLLSAADNELKAELAKIQHELFDCGADLSIKMERQVRYPFKVSAEMVRFLEERIDVYMAETPPLERFILPGGLQVAACLHLTRTVVRRAERKVVTLARKQEMNQYVQQYLNRLSDYLFAVARVINYRSGYADPEYVHSGKVFRQDSD